MPPVVSLLDRYPIYKNDFYEKEEKVYCKFCKSLVDHQKKHNLDSHLKTNKHERQKKIAEASEISPNHQNLTMLQTQITDRQEINVDLIKTLTKADIFLEKVKKLKLF